MKINICIDTTIFKNFEVSKEELIKFFQKINSNNFAYEGEKDLINKTFFRVIHMFVSEEDVSLDVYLELREKYQNLDDGEICLMAFAKENGYCFISDDKKARKRAKRENIHPCCISNYNIGGSIGILLLCIELNLISKLDALKLYELMKNKNRLPKKSLTEFKLEECLK